MLFQSAPNFWVATFVHAPLAACFYSVTVSVSPSGPGLGQENRPAATMRRLLTRTVFAVASQPPVVAVTVCTPPDPVDVEVVVPGVLVTIAAHKMMSSPNNTLRIVAANAATSFAHSAL